MELCVQCTRIQFTTEEYKGHLRYTFMQICWQNILKFQVLQAVASPGAPPPHVPPMRFVKFKNYTLIFALIVKTEYVPFLNFNKQAWIQPMLTPPPPPPLLFRRPKRYCPIVQIMIV